MGELSMGGISRPVTHADIDLFREMQALQARHRVPVLQAADQPNSYVFIALFDGTGQDLHDPTQRPTNVGKLAQQADRLEKDPSRRIAGHYVEGIGTQKNPAVRIADSLVPHSWDEKIQEAYAALADQVQRWRLTNPDAQIALAAVGYSRGAVLVPGLLRLVDTHGIVDPDGLSFGRDAQGNITVQSTRPPLVPPGQVPQIAGLFDPVATAMPEHYDARLNPRTLSAFAQLAAGEARTLFPHQTIVDPGLSGDGRLLSARAAGGHANTGGGNADAALERMTFNAMVDYLNTAFDRAPFSALPMAATLDQATAHQVGGPTAGFGLRVDRDGRRNLRDELADCAVVNPCRDAEPLDEVFASRFNWRTVTPSWQVPTIAAERTSPDHPGHPDHARLQQLRAGVRELDAQVGKPFDERSERLSRALLAATKDGGDVAYVPATAGAALARVDQVLLGTDGRYAFAVQGRPHDPDRQFVGVLIEKALSVPVEQSDVRLEQANARIEQARNVAPAPEQPRAQAVSMSMH